jgi:hypothetical protein
VHARVNLPHPVPAAVQDIQIITAGASRDRDRHRAKAKPQAQQTRRLAAGCCGRFQPRLCENSELRRFRGLPHPYLKADRRVWNYLEARPASRRCSRRVFTQPRPKPDLARHEALRSISDFGMQANACHGGGGRMPFAPLDAAANRCSVNIWTRRWCPAWRACTRKLLVTVRGRHEIAGTSRNAPDQERLGVATLCRCCVKSPRPRPSGCGHAAIACLTAPCAMATAGSS